MDRHAMDYYVSEIIIIIHFFPLLNMRLNYNLNIIKKNIR